MFNLNLKKSVLLIFLINVLIVSCKITKDTKTTNSVDNLNSDFEISLADTLTPEWFYEKSTTYKPSSTIKNDVLHMKLRVSFDWEKQYVLGVSELIVKPHFYPQSTLILDAKGFEIKLVQMIYSNGNSTALNYVYDREQIHIQLDREYSSEEQYIVQIEYIAKPNELPEGGSLAITSDKGLYFINPLNEDKSKPRQIWTQGETQANSCWFPIIDDPNEKYTQEMYITVDSSFKTLSNGALIYSMIDANGNKTDYWKQSLPHSAYLTMLAVGDFAIVKDSWKDIEVSYYVDPEYEKYAKSIFGNTPEMIDFFSNLLNYDYPWEKYSQIVVQDFVSGAMENTTATVMMPAVQSTDRQLIDQHWDGIIAHELFHHWFGDLVTCESWANLPLNESFANYSEFLWDEYKYGSLEAEINAYRELSIYLQEAQNKREPLIRYFYNDKEEMFDAHSYNKGGRVLHMLRNYVGDDAFFLSLHNYLKKNEFQTAEIHDLRIEFEKVTGEDLNWFFNQWFLQLGHPELKIKHFYNLELQQVTVEVEQIQDVNYSPLFQIPTKIALWKNGVKEEFDVFIKEQKETFVFQSEVEPDFIVFDSEQILLASIEHEKTQQELLNQAVQADKYLARFKAFESLRYSYETNIMEANTRNVFLQGLDDEAWAIRYYLLLLLQDYSGEGKEDVINKVMQLAQKDSKSIVMAEAISALVSFDSTANIDLYKEKLKHPSPFVESSALYAYLKTNDTNKTQVLMQYENSNDAEIISVLSDFYQHSKEIETEKWFLDVLNADSEIFYEIAFAYANYVKNIKDEQITTSAINYFKEIAFSNSIKEWKKITCYRALKLINTSDSEEVANQIKLTETNEQLKKFYDFFD